MLSVYEVTMQVWRDKGGRSTNLGAPDGQE